MACMTCRAVLRGVASQPPSCGLALRCAGHHRASARPPLTARSAQPSGTQRRGARRRDGATSLPATKARRDGRLTEATLGDDKNKDMGCPGATTRRGRLHARLDWPASPERASTCVGHSCACAHAASLCPLGAAVWKPEAQHETTLWRTNVPYKTVHGSTANIHTRLIARR
jgi:hypothetical protein